MPLWNVRDFGATGRFDPAHPTQSTDDTPAILAALAFINGGTNNYWGTLYFPAGLYQITDKGWGSPASQNVQAIQVTGATGNNFTLTIVVGTSLTAASTYVTAAIPYSGSTSAGGI